MQRPLDPQQGFSGNVPFLNRDKWRRRRLPHYDAGGIYQMITYRLADALPQDLLRRWRDELKPGSAGCQPVVASFPGSAGCQPVVAHDVSSAELAFRRRCEEALDAGHGSCLLRQPRNARIVIDNWLHFDGQRYLIIAFVVMPNHDHIRVLGP